MEIRLVTMVVLALPVAMASCKKDEDNKPIPAEKICRPTMVRQGTTAEVAVKTSESFYDDNNRLTRINNFTAPEGRASGYQLITYDGSGKAERTDFYDSLNAVRISQHYFYDAEGRITKTLLKAGGHSTPSTTYQYNAANQVVRSTDYFGTDTARLSYITYTYTNGNISLKQFYSRQSDGTFALSALVEQMHDDKKAISSGVLSPYQLLFKSKNNLTRYTYKDASGNVVPGQSYNYTHEYNAEGYPVKLSSTSFDNNPSSARVYWYDYNCR